MVPKCLKQISGQISVVTFIFASMVITQFSYAQENFGAVLTHDIGLSSTVTYPAKGSSLPIRNEAVFGSNRSGQPKAKEVGPTGLVGSLRHLSLFPNPARTMINIQLADTDLKGYTLHMIDMQGRAKVREVWNGDQVDVSALPPGLYTVMLRKGDKTFAQKLVIAR